MTRRSAPIRVAVIGGGLGFDGPLIAGVLARNPILDVQLYDPADDVYGSGGIIELSFGAVKALGGVIPNVDEILKTKVGAVPMDEAHIVKASQPEIGAHVLNLGTRGLVMDKSRLLKELLAPLVPRGALHSDKKLRSLRQMRNGTVELNFAYGEVVECDAVIGADGIWSFVRDYVAPQQEASPAGWWECTAVASSEDLKAALKDAPFGDDAEYHWMGNGLYVLHALVGDRTQGLCLAVVVDSDSPTIPSQPITKEVLKSRLATGTVGHAIPQKIVELMLKSPELEAWSYVEHKSTSTYANDRVCIMGDGAHISSVWQGAPWVLSTEDAFILGSLFNSSSVSSASDVSAVFKAFDAVRRPRCQEVIDKSREAGRLSCHHKGDPEWSPDKLGDMLRQLQAPLNCLDLESHKESALKHLRESLDSC